MTATKQSGLAIVGVYWYPHEAHLARALLETEGIPAWVLDEHQVQMRWHLAAALGGVKVAVSPHDAERASALLAEDRSQELNDVPEAQLAPAEQERCPRCNQGGHTISVASRLPVALQWLATIGFAFLGALVPLRRMRVNYRCPACTHTWSTRAR